MIYTTGSIVRVLVQDSGEMVIGIVMRIVNDLVVVASRLQVAGGRIVYSREVLGEVIEVIDGPDVHPQPAAVDLAPVDPVTAFDTPIEVRGGAMFGGVLEGEDGA